MFEADFKNTIIDLAHLFGWSVVHFRPAQTNKGWRTPVEADAAGWPDLVLVRGERLLFAELKSDKGKLTEAQVEWLEKLKQTSAEVWVWRPDDFELAKKILEKENE